MVFSVPNKVVSLEDRLPKLKEQRKKRANRRLIILLFLFFLFVSGFIYVQSPYSRVGEINVKGNKFLTSEKIRKESGLTEKTIVLNIRKSEIEKQLLQLPEVKKAIIQISFPNQINIEVKEYNQLAYKFTDGRAKLILENGHTSNSQSTEPAPFLKKFDEKQPLNMIVKQLKAMPIEIRQSISEIVLSPKKTDPSSIVAYMNDGNEVRATIRTFAQKMVYYPELVKQLDPNEKGVIDLEVGFFFKSYQSLEAKKKGSSKEKQIKETTSGREEEDEN